MSEYQARGKSYVSQGDRKLLSFGWFGNKYEDAADLFEKGANQFKLAKSWKDAGDAYVKLADVHLKLESKHDSAAAWVEAAKSYQKIDEKKAVNCLKQAVSLYTDMGRLGMAARQLREIAEVLEKAEDKETSLLFYEQAADLFATDNSTAEANKALLKVAQFSAEAESYRKAMDIYERVARAAADNNLLRFSAKGHLLHACLCGLCFMEPSTLKDQMERYKDIDINFDGSRECNLIEAVIEGIDAGDVEGFTTAIAEYDSLTRLDAFKTGLLLKAKRRLTEIPEHDEDEEDLT